jgi:molybdopterin converting factor small subunit
MNPAKIQVKIELFGAFRQFTKQDTLELSVEQGIKLPELRKALERALHETPNKSLQSLIESSAFADEKAILDESLSLDHDMTLAVLPPVCGG